MGAARRIGLRRLFWVSTSVRLSSPRAPAKLYVIIKWPSRTRLFPRSSRKPRPRSRSTTTQSAEPLLKQVVAADPGNYQAWFDLGFVYNGMGNTPESIAAYRKSVAAKPDVFESNLNLGLMLAKTGQPDAEQFLRAATTLTPTANVEEGHERAWLSLGART